VTEAQKQQSKALHIITYLSTTKTTINLPHEFPPQAENSLCERQHRQKTESQELPMQGIQKTSGINQLGQAKQQKRKLEPIAINIITNNINGLKVQSSPCLLESLFQKMIDADINILLIQEVNTNLVHHKSAKIIQKATHHYQSIQHVWSHTPYNTTTSYKPGGVALFIKNPLAKHVVQRIIDNLGRWAGVTNTLKKITITILSIYHSPKQQAKGTINVMSQQLRWLQ
jgi:hypothetical protein